MNEQRKALQQELAAMHGTLTAEQADRRNTLMLLLGYDVPSVLLYTALPEISLIHLKEAIWQYMSIVKLDGDSAERLANLANAIESEIDHED